MNFRIREAIPSDAEQILEHTRICGAETNNMSYGAEGLTMTVEEEADFLEKLNNSDNQIMLVAEMDEVIVGTANYFTSNRKRMSHRGSIGLSVQKQYWNQGIASSFIKELIRFAKEKAGAKIISLEVKCDNEVAIYLYKKFGFKKFATFEGYFEINEELIDFDYMNLKL